MFMNFCRNFILQTILSTLIYIELFIKYYKLNLLSGKIDIHLHCEVFGVILQNFIKILLDFLKVKYFGNILYPP
jgi:hypothetical protein